MYSAHVDGKDGTKIVHTDGVKDMEVSSQYPQVSISTGGDRISILDLNTGTPLQAFSSAQKARFTPDGLGLLMIDSGGRPSMWRFQPAEHVSVGEPFALAPGGPLGQFFHMSNIESPPVVRSPSQLWWYLSLDSYHVRIRHWGTTFQSRRTASSAATATLP